MPRAKRNPTTPPLRYTIPETRISYAGKVMWEVRENNGRCGCGACNMVSVIAYFEHKIDAINFAVLKEKKSSAIKGVIDNALESLHSQTKPPNKRRK